MEEHVSLIDILAQVTGITAVIGGGGKSTLLKAGGTGLAQRGYRVVLATSTHMFPDRKIALVRQDEEGAPRHLKLPSLVQVGCLEERTGKLTAPKTPWAELAGASDFVLVEADGSRGLPFKAHNEHEPQIPAGCARVIYMVGASGFGMPVYDVVHRPQIFRTVTGCAQDEPATPHAVAAGILSEGLVGMPDDLVIVNQADKPGRMDAARELARELQTVLDCPVLAGSVREDRLYRLT